MSTMPHHIRERLRAWHLKRVPFPVVPIIDPYNSDPLQNGSIFEPALRQVELDHIRKVVFGEGYADMTQLWSWLYARRLYGRNLGMGKTALLVHVASAINRDFGRTFFDWSAHWLCVYVLVQPRTKSIDEMLTLALVGLCNDVHGKSTIELLRARLRRKVLILNQAGTFAANLRNAQEKSFANDQWLLNHGVDLEQLSLAVERHLATNQVKLEVAQAIANNTFHEYLTQLNNGSLRHQPAARLVKAAPDLFLNEIAQVVKLAEIKHLTILLDDFYHLILRTAPTDRPELAATIRSTIRDGHSVANQESLYNWLAVIHTTTAGKFNAAWEGRDLHQIAKLDYQRDEKGTALKPLPYSAGRQMLEVYLKSQRLGHTAPSPTFPFTAEALEAIAQISSDAVNAGSDTCEPRSLLQAAFEVTRVALQSEAISLPLDKNFIEHVLQGTPLLASLQAIDSDDDIAPGESPLPLQRPCPCQCHIEAGETLEDLIAILADGTGKEEGSNILGYYCKACNLTVPLES